ncbi:hypothetical protein [Streptomyces chrestomyceticus]|uniref:hypothetical protein n=1 Tax=Streptomyces chrestomyceticus TaxID=68185 RepID=UPI0019CFEB43|nr:hypothetical protein [Streptomyces chrestomyceticus]
MSHHYENLSPAETAREIMCDLGEAARAVGIQFPSLRLDPHRSPGWARPLISSKPAASTSSRLCR